MTTTFDSLVPPAPLGRLDGITRDYSPGDVVKLRGSLRVSHTLAEHTANKLWALLKGGDYVHALGAMTGNQAVQMVRARERPTPKIAVNAISACWWFGIFTPPIRAMPVLAAKSLRF